MPHSLPRPEAIIFDLDGTLVDSLQDIADAFNYALNLLSLPTRTIDEYRDLVGDGVPVLCQRAIGQSHPHLVNRLAELARPYYRLNALRCTKPYPGVPDLLIRLRQSGTQLAVLSNKPHIMTNAVVRAFWDGETFARVQGYQEERFRKPDPTYGLSICEQLGVTPDAVWFVGDTNTDMETALRMGAVPVGVAWGFRPTRELRDAGAAFIATNPSDLG